MYCCQNPGSVAPFLRQSSGDALENDRRVLLSLIIKGWILGGHSGSTTSFLNTDADDSWRYHSSGIILGQLCKWTAVSRLGRGHAEFLGDPKGIVYDDFYLSIDPTESEKEKTDEQQCPPHRAMSNETHFRVTEAFFVR